MSPFEPQPPIDGAPPVILDVRGLRKTFRGRAGSVVRAVDDVSFHVRRGETFGLVGESGCGKTTAARCILRLIPADAGEVFYEGADVLRLPPAQVRALRRRMQIVLQDPYSSLDPRMTIRASLLEPLEIHRVGSRAEREARVRELLQLVGLPESSLRKYPHEFSGGQRQRIGIARALALSPNLVVADEPVSALDLSIRAQIINLLADLQERLGLSYLLIAHDLTLVRHVCHRVAVMRRGQIVELAGSDELFSQPQHPYTRRLMAAIPNPDPALRGSRTVLEDEAAAEEDDLPLHESSPGHWVRARPA